MLSLTLTIELLIVLAAAYTIGVLCGMVLYRLIQRKWF